MGSISELTQSVLKKILGDNAVIDQVISLDSNTGAADVTVNGKKKRYQFPKMDIGEMFVNAPLIAYAHEGDNINDVIDTAMDWNEAALMKGADYDLGEETVQFNSGVSVYKTVSILDRSVLYKGVFSVVIYNHDETNLGGIKVRDLRNEKIDTSVLDWGLTLPCYILSVPYDVIAGETIGTEWDSELTSVFYKISPVFPIDSVVPLFHTAVVSGVGEDEISQYAIVNISGRDILIRYSSKGDRAVTLISETGLP